MAIAGLAGLWYTRALAWVCVTAFALNSDGVPSLFCALYKFPHCMAMVVGSFLLTPLAFTQFDRSLAFSPTLNSPALLKVLAPPCRGDNMTVLADKISSKFAVLIAARLSRHVEPFLIGDDRRVRVQRGLRKAI
jgi:hypothetical protein